MSESESSQTKTASLELERIIFFSDAIIAIAITLLTFQVGLPDVLTADALPQVILGLMPELAIYALSFLIIGNYWVIHHRVFRNIRNYDSILVWLNVLFLMCIAYLPVPGHLFGRFPTEQPAIIFFDICLLCTGLAQTSIWWYASRHHRLIDPRFSSALIRWGMIRSLLPPAVMLISILLTFVNTMMAVFSWGLIWVGYVILNRYFPRSTT